MNKKILLIHGPNLNLLGKRDVAIYGNLSLKDLEKLVSDEAAKVGVDFECFQSNHEGALIDWIQEKSSGGGAEMSVGILINPGALTHYSYALHDALVDTKLPCVEVHLSDIKGREPWRALSVTAPACIKSFSGNKDESYREAVSFLIKHILN